MHADAGPNTEKERRICKKACKNNKSNKYVLEQVTADSLERANEKVRNHLKTHLIKDRPVLTIKGSTPEDKQNKSEKKLRDLANAMAIALRMHACSREEMQPYILDVRKSLNSVERDVRLDFVRNNLADIWRYALVENGCKEVVRIDSSKSLSLAVHNVMQQHYMRMYRILMDAWEVTDLEMFIAVLQAAMTGVVPIMVISCSSNASEETDSLRSRVAKCFDMMKCTFCNIYMLLIGKSPSYSINRNEVYYGDISRCYDSYNPYEVIYGCEFNNLGSLIEVCRQQNIYPFYMKEKEEVKVETKAEIEPEAGEEKEENIIDRLLYYLDMLKVFDDHNLLEYRHICNGNYVKRKYKKSRKFRPYGLFFRKTYLNLFTLRMSNMFSWIKGLECATTHSSGNQPKGAEPWECIDSRILKANEKHIKCKPAMYMHQKVMNAAQAITSFGADLYRRGASRFQSCFAIEEPETMDSKDLIYHKQMNDVFKSYPIHIKPPLFKIEDTICELEENTLNSETSLKLYLKMAKILRHHFCLIDILKNGSNQDLSKVVRIATCMKKVFKRVLKNNLYLYVISDAKKDPVLAQEKYNQNETRLLSRSDLYSFIRDLIFLFRFLILACILISVFFLVFFVFYTRGNLLKFPQKLDHSLKTINRM
ncbi:uncharacterized protein NEMAJ01_1767 [Nematocida major]|uniref:uncharacterized protein n=1 Tax=Nematocida major TaxID=1912982 RepID=UPI002007A88E|nr:uncharacterized protein NEMAJ01_1767 [Nematocida major]KAH9386871.1 hypothetical protein NEMAJ01_1767 [Nematocida major]